MLREKSVVECTGCRFHRRSGLTQDLYSAEDESLARWRPTVSVLARTLEDQLGFQTQQIQHGSEFKHTRLVCARDVYVTLNKQGFKWQIKIPSVGSKKEVCRFSFTFAMFACGNSYFKRKLRSFPWPIAHVVDIVDYISPCILLLSSSG